MKEKEILEFYRAIDAFDTRTFTSFLAEEALFRFGNMPVLRGRTGIFNFVAGFFQTIKAISHAQLEIWEMEQVCLINGNVTYTRLDGTRLTVPFSHTLKTDGGKIREFLIFIDNHELFQKS
jgi:hypothetical protein